MKYLFAAVYVLVLITQLPHVWYAYANLEAPELQLAQWTAVGAALAFELATGVFTYRIINGSRRRWTRVGIAFFIVASVVANGYYYQVAPLVFDRIWPAFAMLALPIALALFAHEFGTEVKRQERAAKRAANKAQQKAEQVEREPEQDIDTMIPIWRCSVPGCNYVATSKAALAGHGNAHRNGRERTPDDVRTVQV